MGRESIIVAIDPKDSSVNPFTTAFSHALAEEGFTVVSFSWKWRLLIQNNVVILHWPDRLQWAGTVGAAIATVRAYSKLWMARQIYGVRFIWVVHNIQPHDREGQSHFLTRLLVRSLDGVIHLSQHSKQRLHEIARLPARISEVVTVHGDYYGVMVTSPTKPPPLHDAVNLVYVGRLRGYKGLEHLASEMADLDDERLRLRIVGWRSNTYDVAALKSLASRVDSVSLDVHSTQLSHLLIERRVRTHDPEGLFCPIERF